MTSFSEGFLDAPLLSDRIASWLQAVRGRSELERELARMDDRELSDLGLSRAFLEDAARR